MARRTGQRHPSRFGVAFVLVRLVALFGLAASCDRGDSAREEELLREVAQAKQRIQELEAKLIARGEDLEPAPAVAPALPETLPTPEPGGTITIELTTKAIKVSGHEVDIDGLERWLTEAQERMTDPVVLIRASDRVPHGRVVDVTNAVKRANIHSLAIAK